MAISRKNLIAAIRVGDRRWTLKLASGLEIMLPDDNIDEALTSLTKLDQERGVLKRDIAAVDLRLLDRVTVRLRDDGVRGTARRRAASRNADGEHQDRQRTRHEKTGFEGRGMGYTTTIRSKRQRIVTALDIGTSKICCLIAKTSPAPDWFEGKGDAVQFEVLGFDHTRAEGLKAGMITHLDSAEACIRSAVDAAERMAGVTVEDVHVSVTCGRLKSESFSASVALPSGAVREDDVMRLLAGGRQYAGRDKRSVLHALPLSYRLDENGGISEPQGMCGERLAVDLHAVTADEVAMRNLMLCVERCHLGVASLVAAPYASALCGDDAGRGQARRRRASISAPAPPRSRCSSTGTSSTPTPSRSAATASPPTSPARFPRPSIMPSGSRRCMAAPSPRCPTSARSSPILPSPACRSRA